MVLASAAWPLRYASSAGVASCQSSALGLAPAERFSVLAHEWAHEMLHHIDRENRPPKDVRETEAEAVAFVVTHAIGLETGTAAADYIRLYQGDAKTLAASLSRIQRSARRMLDAIGPDDSAALSTERPRIDGFGPSRQR